MEENAKYGNDIAFELAREVDRKVSHRAEHYILEGVLGLAKRSSES